MLGYTITHLYIGCGELQATFSDEGKASAKVNPTASPPVTVDHLERLIKAVNKRNVTPAPSGIEHTTAINWAIALANAVTKYQKLGKAIEPKQEENGSNFPVWCSSLVNTVMTVFERAKDFDVKTEDSQPDRGKLIGILVENSVYTNLIPDIQGMQGREYIPKSTDARVSHRQELPSLSRSPAARHRSIVFASKSKSGITEELLLAMGLQARCQANYQEIANALESCLAVDKDSKVLAKYVLELAGHFEAGPAPANSVFAFRPQQHGGRGPRILVGSQFWLSDVAK
ncbi:uncharacterized protein VP01_1010g5 [Puccinia sorghi]|uniref:Uncharacterized protein n=1 Tax=Puccinia sorghi TaxID=27349 RepID=A0A0L6VWE9_9BASI|nr:uncharacterized protein VP01_1010g5 [Puccinia sorghi]